MARVSVIIPTYNYCHFLGEAIQSVLEQTFSDFELIVVDDGSTDNTKEVVDSFGDSRIRYIYQENRGVSAARNTGIKVSSGEYVAFLDSDDMWLPENLELKVKVLDSRSDVALICSDAYVFNDDTSDILGRLWHDKKSADRVNLQRVSKQPLKEMLSRGGFIAPQLTVVRREVFTEVGYFDESLYVGEDWDMFIRIFLRFPIEVLDKPLVRMRKHRDSLTANWDKIDLMRGLAAYDKVIRSYYLSDEHLKLVKRKLSRTLFRLGRNMVIEGKVTTGRERLLSAIETNPWCVRPYVYLAVSFLGGRVILTIKLWKKRLRSLLVWRKMSAVA
jgi:glycosyltransferase involved in cell wall biosynthesis